MSYRYHTLTLWAVTTAFAFAAERSGEWPRFRGPQGDAVSAETGLLDAWPEGGPPLLWKLKGLGDGYSSISIAAGKLFTMGDRGDGSSKAQHIIAFDLASRAELWAARVGPPHGDGGPRCTPTFDDGLVYALGTSADLVCVEASSGKEVWRKNLERDFRGSMMSGWRWSESPLVDGPRLICTPGATDAALVALDKKTGEVIWKCAAPDLGPNGKPGAAYSSCVVAEVGGIRQYVQLMGKGLVGVAADDGRFLWGYNKVANTVANIPSPLVRGDRVFASTAYRAGSALLKLTPDGKGIKAEEVYFIPASQFSNHHGGVVLVGDHLYGGDGQNAGAPTCIEFATGKIVWKKPAPYGGSAAILYAEGSLYFRYEKNDMTLVEASPREYVQKGSFKIASDARGPSWPHPVIVDRKLYLRHGDVLVCYDLAKK